MVHPKMFDDDDPVLARVRHIALALPETAEKVSRDLAKMLTLLDKRITEAILDDNFKKFIDFGDADQAMSDAIFNNNIKKDMKIVDGITIAINERGNVKTIK